MSVLPKIVAPELCKTLEMWQDIFVATLEVATEAWTGPYVSHGLCQSPNCFRYVMPYFLSLWMKQKLRNHFPPFGVDKVGSTDNIELWKSICYY